MTILIFLSALMGGMFIGMPISFALLGAAVALMFHLDMFDAQIIAQNLINGTTSFTLMAVPFFLLAGEVMNVGGLSKRIVKVAMALVGHKRGGLGYVTIIAAILLAVVSTLLQPFPEIRMILYSLVLVVLMVFRPQGIMGSRELSLSLFSKLLPGRRQTRTKVTAEDAA